MKIKKTYIKVAASVALLLVAAIILFHTYGPRKASKPAREIYICEDCGYQFTPDWKALQKKYPNMDITQVKEANLPIPCPKCGKRSAREAIVCPKCKKAFLKFKKGDRCPYCNYKF